MTKEESPAGNKDILLCHCSLCDKDFWDKRVNGFFYQDCPYCREKLNAYLREQRRKEKLERMDRIRQSCGLDEDMQAKTLKNFDTLGDKARKTAKDKVTDYTRELPKAKGLYLFGGVGSGKTHLAAAIATAGINRGLTVYYTTFGDMCRYIRSANDKMGMSEYDAMEKYTKPDMLILDDLGKEKPTEWNISLLYSLVNDLYNHHKRLIVTTNYSISGLSGKLTPPGDDGETIKAIESRFYEMLTPVKMEFADYRRLGWE